MVHSAQITGNQKVFIKNSKNDHIQASRKKSSKELGTFCKMLKDYIFYEVLTL